jgi:hypothetical protein
MKMLRSLTVLALAVLLALAVGVPSNAQLGDTDVSSFTVQNISGGEAQISVRFIAEDGTSYTPDQLDGEGNVSNPFTLADGESQQVYVPNVPGLPDGRYAVEISSSGEIVAQAGVAGTGTLRFSGSYIGFDSGNTTTYLPSIAYNFSGWYSMISVQNLGTDPADVTVAITCADGTTGTLTRNDIPAKASYTWALKNDTPVGFDTSTVCDGSAQITTAGGQPIVAVNNQNKPNTGATNTFEGAAAGADTIYIPSLSYDYSGWNSALTIRKLGSGSTDVTVSYDDGDPDDTFTLTDASPSQKLYMPSYHDQTGRFGAVVESTDGMELLAVVGTTKASEGWSGATSGVLAGTGSSTVDIPNVSKNYFGWQSAINCQNVGDVATTLNVSYAGHSADAYETASLSAGGSTQILVFNEPFLGGDENKFQGGATITANAAGAEIACTVGNSNPNKAADNPGDWTSQYNAFNR